jgi:hypothetical protein
VREGQKILPIGRLREESASGGEHIAIDLTLLVGDLPEAGDVGDILVERSREHGQLGGGAILWRQNCTREGDRRHSCRAQDHSTPGSDHTCRHVAN